jgi:hypothetical protein
MADTINVTVRVLCSTKLNPKLPVTEQVSDAIDAVAKSVIIKEQDGVTINHVQIDGSFAQPIL